MRAFVLRNGFHANDATRALRWQLSWTVTLDEPDSLSENRYKWFWTRSSEAPGEPWIPVNGYKKRAHAPSRRVAGTDDRVAVERWQE